ncbi:MAG: lytic transglycosylase domain-containing protein [Methylophilaceae bacterium]|nr:lytic transglycosylase domain-containing protein [Methylophilaceae bacterium]
MHAVIPKHLVYVVLTLILWVGCSSPLAASERDDFAAARLAYKARNEEALAFYAERLHAASYILAPYVEYWRLLLQLDTAGDTQVQSFLQRYADYPFVERVRTEWLKLLGKKQAWQPFFEEYTKLKREDPAVSCYAARGRYVQGDSSALWQARSLWLKSDDLPTNCDALFRLMRDRGILTEQDVWSRMRLAFQANRPSVAKAVARYLDDPPAASRLKLIDQAYENPQKVLEKKLIKPDSRLGRELMLYALERLARSQPGVAMAWWDKIHPHYNRHDQAYAWGRLALHAARRHDPEAITLYRQAGAVALDAEQLAWKARAHLRMRDWDGLLSAVAEMSQAQQDEAVWRYWKARALKEKNDIAAANALFIPLSKEHSFYGLLAEEELGDVISVPLISNRASEAEVIAVGQAPGIQRAIELYQLDMRWEAKVEWLAAIQNFSDKQLIAAAELAFRQEWYDVAINTADRTMLTHDFALRYPTPYRDMMEAYIRDSQLDEAWVYGLIRQESRFVSAARSSAGAMGLMQVMPATARWIAKRIGFADYHPGLIAQKDTNVQMGTYYLRHVLDEMDGQLLMATAAYNAGPGRPKRWADDKPMEGAIYAETIPFTETRDYVQKVMANAHFYTHRLGKKIQSLKQRIGVVIKGRGEGVRMQENQ